MYLGLRFNIIVFPIGSVMLLCYRPLHFPIKLYTFVVVYAWECVSKDYSVDYLKYCKTLCISLTHVIAAPSLWTNPIDCTGHVIMVILVLYYSSKNSHISCSPTLGRPYKPHQHTSHGFFYARFYGNFCALVYNGY